MAAILDTGRCWRTQFWKGTTQGSFQQSLVEIGSIVSEEKIFLISFPFFLIWWTLNFCLFWPITQIRKKGNEIKKIFSSETTKPISTKLCWNDPWVVPFQNCVRQRRPVSKEISILSHGGHFGYRTVLTDTILKRDHPRIISAKFGWDWLSSFRGEDFF
jgi:hypothetical protein